VGCIHGLHGCDRSVGVIVLTFVYWPTPLLALCGVPQDQVVCPPFHGQRQSKLCISSHRIACTTGVIASTLFRQPYGHVDLLKVSLQAPSTWKSRFLSCSCTRAAHVRRLSVTYQLVVIRTHVSSSLQCTQRMRPVPIIHPCTKHRVSHQTRAMFRQVSTRNVRLQQHPWRAQNVLLDSLSCDTL
jgi:hypothetical protein